MNLFLLLMALLLAFGMAMAIEEAALKRIIEKCRDERHKCKSKSKSSKRYVHFARLLMCQLQFDNCVSEIPDHQRNRFM
ncbi:hypothetical protein ScPMuIL_002520 [Solemya velum]